MSNIIKKRRVTLKYKRPNPLFEKWLEEWKTEYADKGSKMQYCFLKALKSLKKYPLPLQTGKDCAILEGFGTKLCIMLDKKLNEHKKSILTGTQPNDLDNKNSNPLDEIELMTENEQLYSNKIDAIQNCNDKNDNCKKNQKQYMPAPRTGAYALLLALYEINRTERTQEPTKENIIHNAQKHCDASFLKPNSNSRYTAWSSIRTLITKGLVSKHTDPTFFTLTDLGKRLACQLYENNSRVSFTSNYSSEVRNDTSVINDNNLIEYGSNNKVNSNLHNENKSKCVDNNISQSTFNSKQNSFGNNIDSEQYNNILNDIDESNKIVFKPHSFNVILLVDIQETAGKKKQSDDVTLDELTRAGVQFTVRHLSVGDFMWIARDDKNRELVLPYIIERKRMDDFGSSIKDGRFHEQKFRLKQSGIKNLIYMVENYGNNQHTGLPLSTLYQAATNTSVQDRFSVKYTSSLKQSIAYIATMTKILCDLYQEKTLIGYNQYNTISSVNNDDTSLLTFSEFNKSAAKTKNFKVRDLFARHLIQLKGISRDMALAIVDKYPTPKSLAEAYKENSDASNEKLLTTIKYGPLKRCIGPVISRTIFNLYCKYNFSEN